MRRHPQRVFAIYIRSIDPDPSRIAAIDQLVEQVRHSGAQLVLAPDSELAATHAAGEGWIAPQALSAIRDDTRADAHAPVPKLRSIRGHG